MSFVTSDVSGGAPADGRIGQLATVAIALVGGAAAGLNWAALHGGDEPTYTGVICSAVAGACRPRICA